MASHATRAEVTPVAAPADLVAAVDRLVGAEWRDSFVRTAITERLRPIRAVRAFVGHLPQSAAPDWATDGSIAAWLREIRDRPDRWTERPVDAAS